MKKVIAIMLATVLLFSQPLYVLADSIGFTDPESGITLQIPKGWKISAQEEFLRFESDTSRVNMTYRYEDLWDGLSRSDKEKLSRQDYNNGIVSKADAADFVGARSKDVKIIQLNDTEYFAVTTTVTRGFFIFKSTTITTSLIRFSNGYMHLFQFEGSTDHKDYEQFEEMVSGAEYSDSPAPNDPPASEPAEVTVPETTEVIVTDADIYRDAVQAYEAGQLAEAQSLFECIPAFEDTQDYLRLIRIRDYGSNTGIGCVYNFSKALADYQKKDIDEAAERFYFADTAQVLLCNTDVACYYLFGNWITPAGAPAYAYFKLHKDASGGYYYTRSTNLSKAVSDCVSIIDGDVRISITSSNTLVFHIDLTAPDCMEIYSYETCKSFTLYRN